MGDIHFCSQCVHCRLYCVDYDPSGMYKGAVDNEGNWYNEGNSLRCSIHTSPHFPKQRYLDDATLCADFKYSKFYTTHEERLETAVFMKPNAPKDDVEHDIMLGKKIDSTVRYEGLDEDLGRPELGEDKIRKAMLRGDGNEVCRLLGIKDRFVLS